MFFQHSESDIAAPDTDDAHHDQLVDGDHEDYRIDDDDNDNDGHETDSDSSDLELEDLGLSPEAIERALATSSRRFSEDSDSASDDDDGGNEESDTATSVDFEARGSSSTAPDESEAEDGSSSDVFVPARTSNSVPVAVVNPMTSTGVMGSRPGYANQVN